MRCKKTRDFDDFYVITIGTSSQNISMLSHVSDNGDVKAKNDVLSEVFFGNDTTPLNIFFTFARIFDVHSRDNWDDDDDHCGVNFFLNFSRYVEHE